MCTHLQYHFSLPLCYTIPPHQVQRIPVRNTDATPTYIVLQCLCLHHAPLRCRPHPRITCTFLRHRNIIHKVGSVLQKAYDTDPPHPTPLLYLHSEEPGILSTPSVPRVRKAALEQSEHCTEISRGALGLLNPAIGAAFWNSWF
ncbi:hypothetical protein KIL84_007183 [Mauremys mutica]|uniref:Uncharacterized protein n=1 Tax=Mauremys mutica TaxID=74926 RepID=A0A9D3X2L6_9SAUR|nr:hypothetical protein KIL84_007183 [Mauremys mutica]